MKAGGRNCLFVVLVIIPQLFFGQTISTIAGNGTSGYSSDGIAATASELSGPQGLALDASGNIYIADLVNNRIRRIDISTGLISTIAGNGTGAYNGDGVLATAAEINQPSALNFDPAGDLYFTDRGNNRVRKITKGTGIISTIAGNGTAGYNGDGIAATTAELSSPNEVSFDASGNIYIADWFNHRVRKVNITTGIISTVAGTGTGGYNGDGIAATTAEINAPCGITFDTMGNMYVCEYGGFRVRMISATTGLISTVAGNGTGGYNGDGIAATAAELNGPAYIKFDNAGNMFIGDASNQRVREISGSTGIISTIAGNGIQGYNGDGISATTAELNDPFYIYFDKINCCLYIADYQNARIRKITGGFAGGCNLAVAPGNFVSCQVLPQITINAGNNSSWVTIADSAGNIAAQINGNGNNLGVINASLFTKTGACRQDMLYRLYLNRNITITPQTQPVSGSVGLRLYLKAEELDSLETAINTIGEGSGVSSINNLGVFKNEEACQTVGTNIAPDLSTTGSAYNADYYVQTSVSSFSSFYFASSLLSAILPVTLSSFTGNRAGSTNILSWQAIAGPEVVFGIERSNDGTHFENIGSVDAVAAGNNSGAYSFSDQHPPASTEYNYYRLSITEQGSLINYSNTIVITGNEIQSVQIAVVPNIIHGSTISVQVTAGNAQPIAFTIADITGRMLFSQTAVIAAGSNHLFLYPPALEPGIYLLYGTMVKGRTPVAHFIVE
jgi:sugar lactone lactonase YvrE